MCNILYLINGNYINKFIIEKIQSFLFSENKYLQYYNDILITY